MGKLDGLLGVFKTVAPSLLKQIAPVIGGSVGGPAGALAAKLLMSKWSGAPDDRELTSGEMEIAVQNATPEQLVELKALDLEHKKNLEQMGVDIFALEVGAVENARELAKKNMWPHIILTVVFVCGYFGMLFGLMVGWLTIPILIKDTLLILIGLLTREIPTIMQFWFGSSHGSKNKDKEE